MTGWTLPSPLGDDDSGIGELYDLAARLHEPWMRQGLCRGSDPSVFFPERGASANDARDVCRDCPVQNQCLNYALVNNLKEGVWGGMTGRQRQRIRLARGITTPRRRRPAA